MTDDTQALGPAERSLDDLLAECIAAEEAGRALDRSALVAKYPQHAPDLREFFANRDRMQRLAAPLRGGASGNGHAQPGTKLRYFGDYELLEEIAVGGMGIVYKARQVSLNRIVAVKMILKGTLASEDDVKRFRAEAEAAANLQHAGIVAIHEVGLHEGQHYFSMDFVDGKSLAQLPREQPLPASQAAEYVRDAAEAVHYAHQQGTLHRDLKPSNILIDQQGRVRITDFGLAKRITGNSDLTLSGQILGTPSYMPPEQALSKRALIGTASDVYSLGAVLYELLAGRPPFRGESPAETLRQVESLDPISPRLLSPAVPRDLETICLKCLEKEPHKRYLTAQHLADDLSRFVRHEPILARPTRVWERAAKWIRRHPTPAGLAASSALALLACVGLIVGQYYNASLKVVNGQLAIAKSKLETRNLELSTTNQALVTAKQGLESSKTQLGEASQKLASALDDVKAERARARRYLYSARMALVQRAADENRSDRVVQLLRSLIPENPDQEDLRDFEWHHLWRKYQGEESRIRGHDAPVTAVAFSQDEKWIAAGSINGSVLLFDAATGKKVTSIAASSNNNAFNIVAFVPGKPQLITDSRGGMSLVLWDLPSGTRCRDYEAGDLIQHAAFSPSGDFVCAITPSARVFVWEIGSGERVASPRDINSSPQRWFPFGGQIGRYFENQRQRYPTRLAFSRDGKRMVIGNTKFTTAAMEGSVSVYDVGTDAPLLKRVLPTMVTDVACSTDGTRVAASAFDRSVRVWDVASGEEICALHADNELQSVTFSPRGSRVVAGSMDGSVMVWSLPGQSVQTLRQGTTSVMCVSFGAEGRLLAGVCGAALVWDVTTGEELHSESVTTSEGGAPGGTCRIKLSSVSGWLAGAHSNRLIEARTGRPARELYGQFAGSYGSAFSKDESLVALACRTRVAVWSTVSGNCLKQFEMPNWACCAAFSPDNTLLAAGSGSEYPFIEGSLRVLELETGRCVEPDRFMAVGVYGLAFSPDGKLLAAAMGNSSDKGAGTGRVRIWDTATWRLVHDLRGHSRCAWEVAFSPSGKRLVSAGGQWGVTRLRAPSDDQAQNVDQRRIQFQSILGPGEAIIWDVVSGHELLNIRTEKGAVFGVDFSPNGCLMAIGTQAGEVKLFDGTPLAETPAYTPLPDGL